MTVAELKALLPADIAVVYLEGYELLAEDVTVDNDGDLQLSCSDDAVEVMVEAMVGGDDDEEDDGMPLTTTEDDEDEEKEDDE
jgi:hypothetical protein